MKYEIGQTVWVMRSNRVCDVRIIGRQMTEISGQPTTHGYQCKYQDGLIRWQWEHDLFESEAELKAAL